MINCTLIKNNIVSLNVNHGFTSLVYYIISLKLKCLCENYPRICFNSILLVAILKV